MKMVHCLFFLPSPFFVTLFFSDAALTPSAIRFKDTLETV